VKKKGKKKRKLHIARPASATEIRKALRITNADVKAALDALDTTKGGK